MNDTKPMLYFFASVVYDRKQYDYYGLHVKEFKGYIQCHASDVFALDHDPSKNEIIIAILGDDDDDIKDVTILNYHTITKSQYEAYSGWFANKISFSNDIFPM